ncbi:NAD/NADP octopine/nopaline dehydrogenase [Bacteroidales bacterium M08MB]|nr:NAD/NADP octopine/nopaline dehydrogenase [Perlabentimonas gracilis]
MTNDVCLTIQELIRIKCTPLANYLNVTLTPSNPILHTTRLYSIFKSYKEGIYWDKQLNFYEDWTNESSEILLKCDNELQLILKKLSQINLDGIKPLSIHYESNTPSELTNKIRSIDAFKGIRTPMVETEFGFIPDFNSRYFTEDFLFGLNIIKAFAEIILLDTPNIDMVLKWFEIATKQPVFNKTGDLIYNLPKKYGVKSINDIIEYYGK